MDGLSGHPGRGERLRLRLTFWALIAWQVGWHEDRLRAHRECDKDGVSSLCHAFSHWRTHTHLKRYVCAYDCTPLRACVCVCGTVCRCVSVTWALQASITNLGCDWGEIQAVSMSGLFYPCCLTTCLTPSTSNPPHCFGGGGIATLCNTKQGNTIHSRLRRRWNRRWSELGLKTHSKCGSLAPKSKVSLRVGVAALETEREKCFSAGRCFIAFPGTARRLPLVWNVADDADA